MLKHITVQVDEGVRVVARRQTYGGRYYYGWLIRTFAPFPDDTADFETRQQHNMKANFCLVMGHTERLEFDPGVPSFNLPPQGATVEAIEAIYQKFCELDEGGVNRWIDAVISLNPIMTETPTDENTPPDPNASEPASNSNA